MPLWSRLAVAVALAVAAATAVTSAAQAIVARQAVGDQARAGADGIAKTLASVLAVRLEIPERLDSGVGAGSAGETGGRTEATNQARLDREAGLRRLLGDVTSGGVREVHVVDARGTPVVTRMIDGRGNASDALRTLDRADAAIVRECIAEGRTVGRVDGSTYRSAAPVLRAEGSSSGAVLVAMTSRSERDAFLGPALAGLASLLAVGLPAALAARRLGLGVSEPLEACAAVLESAGTGEVGAPLPRPFGVETARLVDATAGMTGAIAESLRRIEAAAALLTAEESTVSAALSRQERAVVGFEVAAVDVAGAIGRIAANSDQVLAATADVTLAAREAARSAQQGRSELDGMSQSMRQLDDEMTAFTRKLATIRQRASGITAVVTTIAKVADQTNLLSVNATIEAEKAGEAGRGFRIVAQEIRRLADQTALATKDIERMVREMQSAVSGGTMEMDRFRKEVSDRVDRVMRLGERLSQIVVPVESVTTSLEQLHDEMDRQSVRAREASELMDRLRGGASQSAETTVSLSSSLEMFRNAIGRLLGEVSRSRVAPPPAATPPGEGPADGEMA